jgi:plasmid stabilization system protein ParE
MQLRLAYLHIRQDSPKNAEKVRTEIIKMCRELARNPRRYGADRYKSDNDGSFRAFEHFNYRIAYYVDEHEVVIVRMRHSGMEPLLY